MKLLILQLLLLIRFVFFNYSYNQIVGRGDTINFFPIDVVGDVNYWFMSVLEGSIDGLTFNNKTGSLTGVVSLDFKFRIGLVNVFGQIYSIEIDILVNDGIGVYSVGSTFLVS